MLAFALSLALGPAVLALAPAGDPPSPLRVSAPVRSAGIYHVTTGTWTRVPGASASAGPDIVFANDAGGSYWTGLLHEDGAQWVDEGQLPGASSPFGADRECYRVNGFQLSYGTSALPGSLSLALDLYDAYVPCTDPSAPGACINQAGTVQVDLPESGAFGGLAFWTITVDLAGGAEIDFGADAAPCAPGYDGAIALDGFGWGATPQGASIGWLLAGDPDWTVAATGGANGEIGGGGTYYAPSSGSCGNTGLNASDLWQGVEPAGGATTLGTGCYSYGYNNVLGCVLGPNTPFASFSFRLFADDVPGAACDAVPDVAFSDPALPHCGTNSGSNPSGPARITYAEDPSGVTAGSLRIVDGPVGEFSMVVCSTGPLTTGVPVSAGLLYLAAPLGRYGQLAGNVDPSLNSVGLFRPDGVSESLFGNGGPSGDGFAIPLQVPPVLGGGTWLPGDTVAFTAWFRCGTASNFSDAVRVQLR